MTTIHSKSASIQWKCVCYMYKWTKMSTDSIREPSPGSWPPSRRTSVRCFPCTGSSLGPLLLQSGSLHKNTVTATLNLTLGTPETVDQKWPTLNSWLIGYRCELCVCVPVWPDAGQDRSERRSYTEACWFPWVWRLAGVNWTHSTDLGRIWQGDDLEHYPHLPPLARDQQAVKTKPKVIKKRVIVQIST